MVMKNSAKKWKGEGVLGNLRATVEKALKSSKSLVIYRDLRKLDIWKIMEQLLENFVDEYFSYDQWMEDYYEFLHLLFCDLSMSGDAHLSWAEWVLDKVLYSENQFSLLCEKRGDDFGAEIGRAVEHDLRCIREIGNIPWNELTMFAAQEKCTEDEYKPLGFESRQDWDNLIKQKGLGEWTPSELARYYKRHGAGIFSRYRGFYWNGNALEGIENIDPITLDQLVGYEIQKSVLMENTEKFLNGYPANNVLLYGDKGTGKSSMVKALIHEYADRGLRMIELPKVHMGDYHKVINGLEKRGFKFILFIDDLSFEENETEYKHIKALLEGGLNARPSNVLVYATSNRRHLVRELTSDRSSMGFHYNDQGEISPTDSMQEKLSLSDRFGITLTFTAPNQQGYLDMVRSIALRRGIKIKDDELREKALQWERRFNGRSGRTARQFIDDLEGKVSDSSKCSF